MEEFLPFPLYNYEQFDNNNKYVQYAEQKLMIQTGSVRKERRKCNVFGSFSHLKKFMQENSKLKDVLHILTQCVKC